MTSQTFYVRTSNTDIMALFENLDNKSKYLEEAVLHFMSCKAHTTKEALQLEALRLKNLHTTLMVHKELKEQRHKDSLQILQGNKELEPPQLPAELNQEEEQGGLNGYSMCSYCKHEHAGTEPRVCKKIECNCGVRG